MDTDLAALAARVEQLEAALAELRTRELAREATLRYATAIDQRDFALLAEAFTEDAVLTTRRGSRTGREAVIEYYRAALADPVDRRHFLANPQVHVDAPGEATVTSYFLYTFAGVDTSVLGWGGYVDRVRIEDGVGRIAAKTISVDVHADSRVGWAGELTP